MAPTWSTSRMPSSTRLTDSVNVNRTSVGGVFSCSPFPGLVLISSACAAAGDGNNSKNKTTSVARWALRRAVVLSGAITWLLGIQQRWVPGTTAARSRPNASSHAGILTGRGQGRSLRCRGGPPAKTPREPYGDQRKRQCRSRNDDQQGRIGPFVALPSGSDLFVLVRPAALIWGRGGLLGWGRRNPENRGWMLRLDRWVGRHLVPVHLLAAGVGLESAEDQVARFGELAEAELEILELARTDAAAGSRPGDFRDNG